MFMLLRFDIGVWLATLEPTQDELKEVLELQFQICRYEYSRLQRLSAREHQERNQRYALMEMAQRNIVDIVTADMQDLHMYVAVWFHHHHDHRTFPDSFFIDCLLICTSAIVRYLLDHLLIDVSPDSLAALPPSLWDCLAHLPWPTLPLPRLLGAMRLIAQTAATARFEIMMAAARCAYAHCFNSMPLFWFSQ